MNPTTTESYNFNQYRTSKKKKMYIIIDCLKKFPEGIFPKQMALNTGIKHNTIKSYLRELAEKGIVISEYGIYTVVKPVDGVDVVNDNYLPTVHNIHLSVDLSGLDKIEHRKHNEIIDDVKFRVIVGSENKKLTCSISAEPPLDYRGFVFAIDKFKQISYNLIGIIISNSHIMVSSIEFIRDYKSVRMDGCNCLTIKEVDGTLMKLYNKKNFLRKETRIKHIPLEAVLKFLDGGYPDYNITKHQINLENEMKGMKEAIKYYNQEIYELKGVMKQVLEKLDSIRSNITTNGIIFEQEKDTSKDTINYIRYNDC